MQIETTLNGPRMTPPDWRNRLSFCGYSGFRRPRRTIEVRDWPIERDKQTAPATTIEPRTIIEEIGRSAIGENP